MCWNLILQDVYAIMVRPVVETLPDDVDITLGGLRYEKVDGINLTLPFKFEGIPALAPTIICGKSWIMQLSCRNIVASRIISVH
jgi:hypothetical protein